MCFGIQNVGSKFLGTLAACTEVFQKKLYVSLSKREPQRIHICLLIHRTHEFVPEKMVITFR